MADKKQYLFIRSRIDVGAGFLAASLYLFNPGPIYNTSYWGQADSLGALFVFIAILTLMGRKYTVAGFGLTLAATIVNLAVFAFFTWAVLFRPADPTCAPGDGSAAIPAPAG